MAHNPKIAMAYAERYMAERGLNPGGIASSSAGQVRSDYDAEQRHQSYSVTKDSLQQVRNQASDINSSQSGVSLRQNMEEKIKQSRQEIALASSDTTNQGSAFKEKLYAEQGKGVVRRVGTKGIQEIKSLANDAVDSGKEVWKRMGESQQK